MTNWLKIFYEILNREVKYLSIRFTAHLKLENWDFMLFPFIKSAIK